MSTKNPGYYRDLIESLLESSTVPKDWKINVANSRYPSHINFDTNISGIVGSSNVVINEIFVPFKSHKICFAFRSDDEDIWLNAKKFQYESLVHQLLVTLGKIQRRTISEIDWSIMDGEPGLCFYDVPPKIIGLLVDEYLEHPDAKKQVMKHFVSAIRNNNTREIPSMLRYLEDRGVRWPELQTIRKNLPSGTW